jgi:energy-coupling factor transport system permease protein
VLAKLAWLANSFIFRRGKSFYHRIDPRNKLLITTLLLALSIISNSIITMSIIIASGLIIGALAKVESRLARGMVFTLGFSVFIFVVNYFLPGGGLFHSLIASFRFVALITSTSIFFLTTSPDELEYVMRWFRLPRDFVFAFVTAVRFVPVLMLDALQIMDAQKSRGLELEKGRFYNRIKNYVPILIPLVVTAVVRSGELAEAMESRAYGASKKPTSVFEMHFGLKEFAILTLAIVLFISALTLSGGWF